jgi:hypothetical protein
MTDPQVESIFDVENPKEASDREVAHRTSDRRGPDGGRDLRILNARIGRGIGRARERAHQRREAGLGGDGNPWKERASAAGNGSGRHGLVGGTRPWSRRSATDRKLASDPRRAADGEHVVDRSEAWGRKVGVEVRTVGHVRGDADDGTAGGERAQRWATAAGEERTFEGCARRRESGTRSEGASATDDRPW